MQSRRRLVVTIVTALTLVGCRETSSGGSAGSRPPPKKGSHGFPSPPTVDGSRKPCLDAPYTPGLGATAFSDGSPVSASKDGRSWRFEIPGTSELKGEEGTALLMAARKRGGQFTWLNYGVYCGDSICFAMRVNLCEGSVEELARSLKTVLSEERGPTTPRLDVVIALEGELGPRDCGGADCDPIPYEGTPYYDRDATRRLGPIPEYGSGACSRDADCMVKGCGNHCVSWEQGGANQAGTCEGYDMPRAFCGCVEKECAWFTQ